MMFEPPGTFNQSNVIAAQKLAAVAEKLVMWAASCPGSGCAG
jgi:hypothetical protein